MDAIIQTDNLKGCITTEIDGECVVTTEKALFQKITQSRRKAQEARKIIEDHTEEVEFKRHKLATLQAKYDERTKQIEKFRKAHFLSAEAELRRARAKRALLI